jgi:hypothetical protein
MDDHPPRGGARLDAAELLPPRRHRSNPRVVKRKMSSYGVKRREHAHAPQQAEPRITIERTN